MAEFGSSETGLGKMWQAERVLPEALTMKLHLGYQWCKVFSGCVVWWKKQVRLVRGAASAVARLGS